MSDLPGAGEHVGLGDLSQPIGGPEFVPCIDLVARTGDIVDWSGETLWALGRGHGGEADEGGE